MSSRVHATVIVRDWLALARLPFHAVGVLPFLLGTVAAVRAGAPLKADVLASGLAVVLGVMLATYLLGEVFDFEGDRLSAQMERNRFSGGTQVLQAGRIDRRHPLYAAVGAIVVASVAGAYVVLATRQLLLIPLGLFGLVAGTLYSVPPFRLAYRGIGETLIGVCYGWLPVAVGFLTQAGRLPGGVSLISIPVSLTIFNVILINEIPDEPADRQVGKRNLVVRFGRKSAAVLYAVVCALTALCLAGLVVAFPTGGAAAWVVAGALAAWALGLGGAMLAGLWKGRHALERMCALSILLNLCVTVALMFVVRL